MVRGGELVGVVSQRDLLRASLSSVMGIEASAHESFLEKVRIADVMSGGPISTTADATIRDAARTMAERKIGCLPVVEGRRLVGIVTETDVLRHYAEQP